MRDKTKYVQRLSYSPTKKLLLLVNVKVIWQHLKTLGTTRQ